MERVYKNLVLIIYLAQNCIRQNINRVCSFISFCILTMLNQSCRITDILANFSAQGTDQSLNSTADTQYRNLSVVSQMYSQQFRQITLCIDAM